MIISMPMKSFLILFLWPLSLVMADIYALPAAPQFKDTPSISRVFEGRLEKTNAFLALFAKWPYALYEKNVRIAYLEFKDKRRDPKIADMFLHKNIIVRGTPQYINQEPYLLIVVDDMCENNSI